MVHPYILFTDVTQINFGDYVTFWTKSRVNVDFELNNEIVKSQILHFVS